MTDFDIAAPARACVVSGRELRPGDAVISVVADDAGKFVRTDYAAEAWSGPPDGAIAWWASRIPTSAKPQKPTYNEDVLLDLFRHLAEAADPQRVSFRYVVALLLMRRKRLKFEDLKKVNGQDVLIVRDVRSGVRYDALDPRLDEEAIVSVQDEVFTALGWT